MNAAVLSISEVLYGLLQRQHITESELARETDIPRATINHLISGRTLDPRASTLTAIAQYFGITVDQLLGKQPLYGSAAQSAVFDGCFLPILHWEEMHHNGENTPQKEKFAVHLKGDAMWPQFQEDALLIIDPKKKAKNRDFVIAYIKKNEETLFRQLLIDSKCHCLKAMNNLFPSIILQPSDNIMGVIIETRKNYS